MKKHSLALLIGLIALSSNLTAKTYTPNELNKMINSGKYPSQGPVTKETKAMEFIPCKTVVQKVINDIKDYYPTSVIVDSGIVYMVKAWTNDAAMTMTCSQADNKLVITQANYN